MDLQRFPSSYHGVIKSAINPWLTVLEIILTWIVILTGKKAIEEFWVLDFAAQSRVISLTPQPLTFVFSSQTGALFSAVAPILNGM